MSLAKNHEIPSVAVIGTGYWGKNLVRNFYQLNALKMICDKSEAALEKLKQQFTGVDTSFALNQVLKREDIDGVVVSTPAETHFNIAREALHAGKHVFVEKPLVLDEEEGKELIHSKTVHHFQRKLLTVDSISYHIKLK